MMPLPFDKTEKEIELEASMKRIEFHLMLAEAQRNASLYLMGMTLNENGEWVKPETRKIKPLSFWDKVKIIFKRKAKKD